MATSMQRKQKPKNRKTKTFLEFNEKDRSEFLKGFHKRKLDRKKLAREEHDKKVLLERKELLKQARDIKKGKLRQHSAVIPEISSLVDSEIYDLPEHTVTIANIGEIDFVGKDGYHLGQNKGFTNNRENLRTDDTNETSVNKPTENKTIRQKLASCSNQLSASKQNAKKMKRKHMLQQKFQAKKKGEKKKNKK